MVCSVSLKPDDVDAIVFWSKNPAPMLASLRELESINPRFYVLFTLNDYPPDLEPGIPPLRERGDLDYHRRRLESLFGQIGPCTERVIISVVDMYGSTCRALKRLESRGWSFPSDPLTEPSLPELLRDISHMAAAAGIGIQSCAEEELVKDCGIAPGACVDGELIRRLWVRCACPRKDPFQRPACLCAVSRDIGAYGTCSHGCVYCYAGCAGKHGKAGSTCIPPSVAKDRAGETQS